MGMTTTAQAFSGIFRGRRVLVTGDTGFKGSWLCEWLLQLGAEVHGLALPPETEPNLFHILQLGRRLASHTDADIRDARAVQAALTRIAPEVVLHLAAQPLVRRSYSQPSETWATNVMGTIHILEAIRATPAVRACVVVTSDKCYENRETFYGYREHDPMGGHDPYSSSKGATELAVSSWRRSFFTAPASCRIATARAGNVIGGGDWSADRIVVDVVRAIAAGQAVQLRNPLATRPWQHVLEPLSGYLALAQRLLSPEGAPSCEAWNFGPAATSVATVQELTQRMIAVWGGGSIACAGNAGQPHEACLLTLDVSKAAARLGWCGVWNLNQTVSQTVAWYRAHQNRASMHDLTLQQLNTYAHDAAVVGQPWASNKEMACACPA
jgi:CDP-glucose 4,6-dehydratase